MTRTAGEVFSDLLERGAAYLPALRSGAGGGRLPCWRAGYGVLEGRRAGGLSGRERPPRGWSCWSGRAPADVLDGGAGGGDGSSAGPRAVSLRC